MPQEPPGPEVPSLSEARLETLLEAVGDQADQVFPRLLEIFRRDAPARLQELRVAFGRGDAEELAKAAHGLKSGAGNLGIERVRALSEGLEAQGRAGDLEGLEAWLEDLEGEVRRGADALEVWMDARR